MKLKEAYIKSENGNVYYTKNSDMFLSMIKSIFISKNIPVRVYFDTIKQLYVFGDAFGYIHADLATSMKYYSKVYGINEMKYNVSYLKQNCALFQVLPNDNFKEYDVGDGYTKGRFLILDDLIFACREKEYTKVRDNVPLFKNHIGEWQDVQYYEYKKSQQAVNESVEYIDNIEVLINPSKQELQKFMKRNRVYRVLLTDNDIAIWKADSSLLHNDVEQAYKEFSDSENLFALNGNIFFVDYDMKPEEIEDFYFEKAEKLDNLPIVKKYFPHSQMKKALDMMKNGISIFNAPNDWHGWLNESVEPKLNDNFWKWFGNSKMKNKNGEPIVFYHTTYSDISVFEPVDYVRGRFIPSEKGIDHYHFSKYKDWTDNFAKDEFVGKEYQNRKTYEVFLRIEKPLVILPVKKTVEDWVKYLNSKNVNISLEEILHISTFGNDFDNEKIYKIPAEIKKNKEKKAEWLKNAIEQNKQWYANRKCEFWRIIRNSNKVLSSYCKKAGYDGILMRDTKRGDARNLTVIVFDSNQIKSVNNNGNWSLTSNNINEAVAPKLNDNFWKWFGNSKVVDSQGNPLVVYHGTDAGKFDTFNMSDKWLKGIKCAYFSSDYDTAASYCMSGYPLEYYLKIENPYILDAKNDKYDSPNRYVEEALKNAYNGGYDGAIVMNIKDDAYQEYEEGVEFPYSTTYIVFNPNQIKSVNNNGNWSLNSNNINESVEDNFNSKNNCKVVLKNGRIIYGKFIDKWEDNTGKGIFIKSNSANKIKKDDIKELYMYYDCEVILKDGRTIYGNFVGDYGDHKLHLDDAFNRKGWAIKDEFIDKVNYKRVLKKELTESVEDKITFKPTKDHFVIGGKDFEEEGCDIYRIYNNDKEIGIMALKEYDGGISLDGLEIGEPYRKKGYGKKVVDILKKKYKRIYVRAIPDAKGFWNKQGHKSVWNDDSGTYDGYLNESVEDKILYIIRGVPGSGKSTLAHKLTDNVVEADQYFYDDEGNYNWSADKLNQAHNWCFYTVKKYMEEGRNKIAVANTFVKKRDYKRYVELAEQFGYKVDIRVCNGNYKNIHGVPDETVERMRSKFQETPLDESIKYLNREHCDTKIITSPYDLKNYILNHKNIRIVYDNYNKWYFVNDADIAVHANILDDAISAGYYDDYDVISGQDILYSPYYKQFPLFVVSDNYNENWSGDGYENAYKYDSFVIYDRYGEFEETTLYQVLGNPLEKISMVDDEQLDESIAYASKKDLSDIILMNPTKKELKDNNLVQCRCMEDSEGNWYFADMENMLHCYMVTALKDEAYFPLFDGNDCYGIAYYDAKSNEFWYNLNDYMYRKECVEQYKNSEYLSTTFPNARIIPNPWGNQGYDELYDDVEELDESAENDKGNNKMIELKKLLESTYILNEGIEEVKKYYKNIPDGMFQKLVELDPSYQGGNQLGKFGKWILGLYNKKLLKDEDFYKVTEYLTTFMNNLSKVPNKDIMSYKSLPDLAKAIQPFEGQKDISNRQQVKDIKRDAKKVFENKNWLIISPKSKEAACYYGANTKWCTAAKEHNMFDTYNSDGPLYIFIDKNDGEKYQLHIPTFQFRNNVDESVPPTDYISDKQVLDFIRKMMYNYITSDDFDIFDERFPLVNINGSEDNFFLLTNINEFLEGIYNQRGEAEQWTIDLMYEYYLHRNDIKYILTKFLESCISEYNDLSSQLEAMNDFKLPSLKQLHYALKNINKISDDKEYIEETLEKLEKIMINQFNDFSNFWKLINIEYNDYGDECLMLNMETYTGEHNLYNAIVDWFMNMNDDLYYDDLFQDICQLNQIPFLDNTELAFALCNYIVDYFKKDKKMTTESFKLLKNPDEKILESYLQVQNLKFAFNPMSDELIVCDELHNPINLNESKEKYITGILSPKLVEVHTDDSKEIIESLLGRRLKKIFGNHYEIICY